MLKLSDSDLRFVVQTVATSRRDHDHIVNLIRDKEDLIEPMLEDTKLLERLFQDDETLVRVSPHLLFSVLLRRVRQELQKETYLLELDSKGKRIPVFEAPAVAEMLGRNPVCDYLAEMLSSFTRTNSGVTYWKERGSWHKRRFSDIDIDDMVELARITDPEMRRVLYRRIADIALFLSGIFPDSAAVFVARPRTAFLARRTLDDYEAEGKRFYGIAARETREAQQQAIFGMLSEKFSLARRALNTLSDRYVKARRTLYFRIPSAENW